MINKLLFNFTAKLPTRLIYLESGPYLERYYLGQFLGVTFYLHRFVRADSERNLHNHPWRSSYSLVLAGRYVEEIVMDLCPSTESGCVVESRHVSWFNSIPGNKFHRITDVSPGTWTLFFHGSRQQVGHINKWVRGAQVRMPILKGWGFLSKMDYYGKTLTTFTLSTPPKSHEWWLEAPTGAKSEREPL